jgi:hypothetical protein
VTCDNVVVVKEWSGNMKSITPDNRATPGKAVYESLDKEKRKNWVIQMFYWDLEDNQTFLFNRNTKGLNLIKGSKFDKVITRI